MNTRQPLVNIGTSGWYYEHWNNVFYPKEVSAAKRLPFYSNHFSTVEINNTFYALPTDKSIENWKRLTPPHFKFAIKASRYITHIKRLTAYQKSTYNFFVRIKALEDKLGPILFQLPPSFKEDLARLQEFIEHLPKEYQYVFEFRHPSWYHETLYQMLRDQNIALCLSDLNGIQTPIELTADFTYIRLHGPHSSYTGAYSLKQIKKWEERLRTWAEKKIQSFCFFDNDAKGDAVKDAMKLKKYFTI